MVGGVIGQKRILFDLWGDTVNIASRMESSGVPGRIQVAPSTFALLRDAFTFEERTGVEVKGVGVMTTYLAVEADIGSGTAAMQSPPSGDESVMSHP